MAVAAMVGIAPILSGMLLALDRAWIPVAIVAAAAATAAGIVGLVFVARRRRSDLERDNALLAAKRVEVVEFLDYEQEFLARSSHELRSPLTSVMGYLEELREGADPLTDEQRSHVEVAYRNAQRLHSLVDELLLINETLGHNLELNPEPTTSAELLEHVAGEYAMQCVRSDLRFEIDVTDDAPLVLIDRARTDQVLNNLLSNALKFTPPGGTIGVEVHPAGESVRINVWDTGMGISPKELDLVFGRFFRSASSAKLKIPGTGLGLPIARAIAEAQGGSLTVANRAGAGSVFTLTVPVCRQPEVVS